MSSHSVIKKRKDKIYVTVLYVGYTYGLVAFKKKLQWYIDWPVYEVCVNLLNYQITFLSESLIAESS